ncbi:trans-sialidase, putative, partial [Trypanosoma cruzi marinkellei]
EREYKTVSLIIYSSATESWKLSKGMSADGCSDPSVVEWNDGKLMMMTACDDGRRRVYESGDKGESWTEALGTLSRVWGKKKDGEAKNVGSGFITATIDDDGTEKRNVMLVTLPVYSTENGKEKGKLHLWLTDNTHIVDIGPVSSDDDAASALLYKSAGSGDQGNNNEKLIALYEKKNVGENKPSPGMVSVVLTEELKRVKEVLATWKKVDERVSQLCPSPIAAQDTPTANACGAVNITDGLVGFLSGNLSDGKWKDEYLGVNATVKGTATAATGTADGVTFTGRGAGAEWPVGNQGENQLYHFANYNFTLVATVSIDGEPKEENPIPLIGVKMNDGNKNTVLLGLLYKNGNKLEFLHGGESANKEHSVSWGQDTTHQVAIVLQNGTQGSVYVDGQRVGGSPSDLKDKGSKEISHFFIGADGSNAEDKVSQEGVSVTVRNVLLYNRPLNDNEIEGLAKNTITVAKPEGSRTSAGGTLPRAVSGSGEQGAVSQPHSGGPQRMEHEQLKGVVVGADGGGASSAASTATTPSSDDAQTVTAGSGGTTQGEGIQPQDGEVNATALNSSLGNMSRGNNTGDASTVGGSGLLPLLLLLGLWGFAAL